jgi:predicted short-subunit dehydrogenase-like oxidoreductase (DUF2520 family)
VRKLWFIVLVIPALLLIGCGGESGSELTADAGDDFSIPVGQAPAFDGCGSAGDIENYQWTIVEAPDKMAADSGKIIREIDANCSFTLDASMGVDEVGDWIIELEVRDSAGQSATDQVKVTVNE